MKNIRIEDSYNTWKPHFMFIDIISKCYDEYKTADADEILNRSFFGMFIEWWLHNIGYWLTRPLIRIAYFERLNERFKHVDLEEHS